MAGDYKNLSQENMVAAFAVVYGIFLSLGELGPGNNIGLLASKSCATYVSLLLGPPLAICVNRVF